MRVADACRLVGQPERALELLEALVAERPTAIAPLVLIAWCLDDLGRDDECRAALEELRAIDPANPWASGSARAPGPGGEPAGSEVEEPLVIERAEAGAEPVVAGPAAGDPELQEPEPSGPESPESEPIGSESEEPTPEEAESGGPAPEEPPPAELPGEPESVEPDERPVFEVPEESDLSAALAEMSALAETPAPEAPPEAGGEPEPEAAVEAPGAGVPHPEVAAGEEAPPRSLAPADTSRDPESEAEPERALTAEELADIPPSPLYSATLAEIFERQGFEEKAMEIYAEVVRTHPERVDLRERIAELERRLPAGPGR
jgi:tetratricopeptide (TPR) repeat protein